MCPKTGLPDFGTIRDPLRARRDVPRVEGAEVLPAGFRNQGIFYEAATNRILDDLVAACQPRRMTVVGDFTARGGISTTSPRSSSKP